MQLGTYDNDLDWQLNLKWGLLKSNNDLPEPQPVMTRIEDHE